MHPQDQNAEMAAFVKAALLYQPMKATMASRFTSASNAPMYNDFDIKLIHIVLLAFTNANHSAMACVVYITLL